MSFSALYGIPLLASGQTNAHLTANEALIRLEQLANLSVISRTVANEPGSPADGDAYYLAGAVSGVNWSSNGGKIAFYYGGWMFLTPREGLRMWVASEQLSMVYTQGGFVTVSGGTVGAADSVYAFRRSVSAITADPAYRIPLFFTPDRVSIVDVRSILTTGSPGLGAHVDWRLYHGASPNGAATPLFSSLQITGDSATGQQHIPINQPQATSGVWFGLVLESLSGVATDFTLSIRYRKA